VEARIADDAFGHAVAGGRERHGAAEAVARQHHVLGVAEPAGGLDAAADHGCEPLGIGEGGLGGGDPAFVGVGAVAGAVDVEREGVVAEFGQHVGAAALVVVEAVPVVHDHHEAAGVLGLGEVAGEGLAPDFVLDILRGGGAGQRQRNGGGSEKADHGSLQYSVSDGTGG
jgi:hypothetical protein